MTFTVSSVGAALYKGNSRTGAELDEPVVVLTYIVNRVLVFIFM